MAAPEGELLTDFLKAARPEWRAKDLAAAAGKLARAGFGNPADLVAALGTSRGARGVNTRVRAIGARAFTDETLAALRRQARKAAAAAAEAAEHPAGAPQLPGTPHLTELPSDGADEGGAAEEAAERPAAREGGGGGAEARWFYMGTPPESEAGEEELGAAGGEAPWHGERSVAYAASAGSDTQVSEASPAFADAGAPPTAALVQACTAEPLRMPTSKEGMHEALRDLGLEAPAGCQARELRQMLVEAGRCRALPPALLRAECLVRGLPAGSATGSCAQLVRLLVCAAFPAASAVGAEVRPEAAPPAGVGGSGGSAVATCSGAGSGSISGPTAGCGAPPRVPSSSSVTLSGLFLTPYEDLLQQYRLRGLAPGGGAAGPPPSKGALALILRAEWRREQLAHLRAAESGAGCASAVAAASG